MSIIYKVLFVASDASDNPLVKELRDEGLEVILATTITAAQQILTSQSDIGAVVSSVRDVTEDKSSVIDGIGLYKFMENRHLDVKFIALKDSYTLANLQRTLRRLGENNEMFETCSPSPDDKDGQYDRRVVAAVMTAIKNRAERAAPELHHIGRFVSRGLRTPESNTTLMI